MSTLKTSPLGIYGIFAAGLRLPWQGQTQWCRPRAGSSLLLQGLTASVWLRLGGTITLTLCFSHLPSPVSVSFSLPAPPRPAPVCFLPCVCFGFCSRCARAAPCPTAELVQLGLLRSLGNLPVSERVQLPDLGQLGLHHGGLGVHREGDRARTRGGPAPDTQHLQPAWALLGTGGRGRARTEGWGALAVHPPEGEEGYGELGGVKAPPQIRRCVLIHLLPYLSQPTGCGVSPCRAVRSSAF